MKSIRYDMQKATLRADLAAALGLTLTHEGLMEGTKRVGSIINPFSFEIADSETTAHIHVAALQIAKVFTHKKEALTA